MTEKTSEQARDAVSVDTALVQDATKNPVSPAASAFEAGEQVAPITLETVPAVMRVRARKKVQTRADLIRQWILLVPLATAVLGTLATQFADEYLALLPSLFFVGALLITVAMLHQRRLFRENEELSDELRAANDHLDLLHRLQLDLNQSLDVAEVSRTVLTHAIQTFEADSGALWLRPHDVAARDSDRLDSRRDWRLEAVYGWSAETRVAVLKGFTESLENDDSGMMFNVQEVPEEERFSDAMMSSDQTHGSAIGFPIKWKDETIGYVLIARRKKRPLPFFDAGDIDLLREFALVTGPALENALLYQRTLTRADIDGLTDLLNHRAIQERLAQELARTQRTRRDPDGARFSIAIFDLADFKLFNDTYGHAIGDEILRTVARTLRSTARVSDIVARYGGDEFLAILPETEEHGAMTICERTIETLRAHPFAAADGSQIVIRITCGIAVYPADGQTGAELFEAADARLYEAKQQGRQLIPYQRVVTDEPAREKASLWGKFGVLDALITAIDNRDHYTRRHSEQVMAYALLCARAAGKSEEILDAVRIGALLYDIGKIAVPDAILRKPGLLSPEEMRLMQQHCRFGAMMVQEVAHRDRVIECVLHHHESWDGSGYPGGLRGAEIPWMGRLVAVADAFAAMTTDRPYRKALAPEVALGELHNAREKRFDPAIVDAMGEVLKDVIAGNATLNDLQDEARALAENPIPKAT